ncbi:MAG: M56 family metallopeptidase [Hominilimicola sp.]
MENLFIDIIEITLPISVWIVLLLLCSPLLKRSYVAKWRYFMWLFVAVRLIFPFRLNIKSPIIMSIPSEISAVQTVAQTLSHTFTVSQILTTLWLLGIAVFAFYQIFSYISFGRMVKRWSEKVTDERILNAFEAAKTRVGVKSQITVKKCKVIKSPMIFGMIKPVLLLPYVDFSDDELPIILRHELVHLKRHDIWYKLLLIAARTIHWFNPAAYIMVKAANRDMELACDAEVVKSENVSFRRHYCEAIMRLVHNGRGNATALSTCFFFSKKTVMERFKNILDDKIKRSGVVMFCVVALSVGVSASAITFATERVAEEIEDNLQIVERPDETLSSATAPTDTPQQIQNDKSDDTYNQVNTGPEYNKKSNPQQAAVNYDYAYTDNYNSDAENTTVSDEETVAGDVGSVEIGDNRSNIYDRLGEPDSVSGDGSKETYNLSDGSTAILQYDGDTLDTGYIVVE